jgi:hypothetical protein
MRVTNVGHPSAEEREAMGPGVQDRGRPCLDIEGTRSLEVRWIFAGPLPAAMAGWIGRFPAQTIMLEDTYLVAPHLPGLSVKVRESHVLEVKVYHGSPGVIDVPGRARGRLEAWQKWSFPCDPVDRGSDDLAGWRAVRKRRRISWFSRASGSAAAHVAEPGGKPGCAVELAEFRALGEDWWTLGLEATGPAAVLRDEFEAAAELVFGQALPGEVELDTNDCMSYAQWLRR